VIGADVCEGQMQFLWGESALGWTYGLKGEGKGWGNEGVVFRKSGFPEERRSQKCATPAGLWVCHFNATKETKGE